MDNAKYIGIHDRTHLVIPKRAVSTSPELRASSERTRLTLYRIRSASLPLVPNSALYRTSLR